MQLAWKVLKDLQLGRYPEEEGPSCLDSTSKCCGRGGMDVGSKEGILDTSLLHQTEPSLRP